MPNIRFENVSISYKNRKAITEVIEDLNISFESNKINVILGDSGCGKTTLLKSLLNIVEYTGNIYFDDKNIHDIDIRKREMSYISQNINLYSNMTVFENISFPLVVRHKDRSEIITKTREIAETLDIAQCLNVKGKFLSMGQQQRAMIARELVFSPNIVIMDEPFSNLDAILRNDLCKLVKDLQKKFNFTLLFVTHSFKEAINMADHLYIMDEGKIVSHGKPRKLLEQNNPYLETMIESERIEILQNETEKNKSSNK